MARKEKRDSDRAEPVDKSAPPSVPPAAHRPSLSLTFQWLFSRTARHANAMCRHVRKILNHQRDLLSPKALEEVEGAMQNIKSAVAAKADNAALEQRLESLEKVANKWLKPYPNAAWRENVEVLLVALAVAMAVRTFFLQPFKIPTGSMQPTLFGVTSKNLNNDPQSRIPKGWARMKAWFHGVSYIHLTAEQDGEIQRITPPVRFLIFNIYQKIVFAGKTYSIWFPPDYGGAKLEDRADIHVQQVFHKGEDIVKLQVNAGDHLFVNRLTYNFCLPQRGDIVVFETKGIPVERRMSVYPPIPADQFYIKRLVGLGGETIALQKDYAVVSRDPVGHLVVNGEPLSASTPHFENLYSYHGARPGTKALTYVENHYFGHALMGELAAGHEYQIPTNHYFVMGDNTMNSLDSRYWGDFPATSVIGKALFVYWPISDRFGWGQQ